MAKLVDKKYKIVTLNSCSGFYMPTSDRAQKIMIELS